MNTTTITATTTRKYDEMLGVLPPARTAINQNISAFLVGEPTDHDTAGAPRYDAYAIAHNATDTDTAYHLGNMTAADFSAFMSQPYDTLREALDDAAIPDNIAREYELREQYGDDAVDAYLSLGIEQNDGLDDFEEAYAGEYDTPEDFARDMADNLGAIDRNVSWPYTCIDWEHAARELMYDYTEENGHYFLNL